MAKKKKRGSGTGKTTPVQQKTTSTQPKPIEQKKSNLAPLKAKSNESKTAVFVFNRQNYILLLVGLAFILVGFLLMIGGGSDDPNVFNEEIFSPRRITVAPILVITGYIIEIFAIMKKPKE
ncbi:DUF3098 domain-containing protein [candidate division KSB1 bacterium]